MTLSPPDYGFAQVAAEATARHAALPPVDRAAKEAEVANIDATERALTQLIDVTVDGEIFTNLTPVEGGALARNCILDGASVVVRRGGEVVPCGLTAEVLVSFNDGSNQRLHARWTPNTCHYAGRAIPGWEVEGEVHANPAGAEFISTGLNEGEVLRGEWRSAEPDKARGFYWRLANA